MIKTDGAPTIAWAPAPARAKEVVRRKTRAERGDTCPLRTTDGRPSAAELKTLALHRIG